MSAIDLECPTSVFLEAVVEFEPGPLYASVADLTTARDELHRYLREASGDAITPDQWIPLNVTDTRRNPEGRWCDVVRTDSHVLWMVPFDQMRDGIDAVLLGYGWDVQRSQSATGHSWRIVAEQDATLVLDGSDNGVSLAWYPPGCVAQPIEIGSSYQAVEQFE